jgi:hypothetical protein
MVRKNLHLRRERGRGTARIANRLSLRAPTVNWVLRREIAFIAMDLAAQRAVGREIQFVQPRLAAAR